MQIRESDLYFITAKCAKCTLTCLNLKRGMGRTPFETLTPDRLVVFTRLKAWISISMAPKNGELETAHSYMPFPLQLEVMPLFPPFRDG